MNLISFPSPSNVKTVLKEASLVVRKKTLTAVRVQQLELKKIDFHV